MSQARFQKQQREKARREKAAAKFARKAERRDAKDAEPDAEPAPDQDVVLAELAELHERFEAGAVSFEDFSEARDALVAQLDVR